MNKSKKTDEKSRIRGKKSKPKDEKKNTNSAKDTAKENLLAPLESLALFGGIFTCTCTLVAMRLCISDKNEIKRMKKLTYEEFERDYLNCGEVKAVKLYGSLFKHFYDIKVVVSLHDDPRRTFQNIAIPNMEISEFKLRLTESEKKLKIARKDSIPYLWDSYASEWTLQLGLILSTICVFYLIYKKTFKIEFTKEERLSMMPGFFKSKSIVLKDEMPKIKFEDIAGLHSAKVEIKEFLDYLKDPDKFIRLGAHLPKGAMLLGPPGCGKTLLIKALAYESNTPFCYKSGPEFVKSIGGLGAKTIRDMFAEAREYAPCIIFIDEIDTIGKKRGVGKNPYADTDADQTLNQLLVEMDGMASVAGVAVFAATNRPDVLDAALLRPGRFDRHISIDLPFLQEREEIFNLYLKKFENKVESSIYILSEKLACQTPGMSGADIANVCNEAALVAAKHNYSIIKDECFYSALERIVEGAVKKSNIMSKSEKKIVAYHEAGHTIVNWFLKNSDPIVKVSIIERTNNKFGFSSYNNENGFMFTTEKLHNQIAVFLGGRAAELITFNKFTSGAEDDLKKVRKLALNMIRNWGMSEKIGHFCYGVPDDVGPYDILPYSKYTEEIIDSEVSKTVLSCFRLAEKIIKENVKHLEVIATELLKKEVLYSKDIETLIGPRPQ